MALAPEEQAVTWHKLGPSKPCMMPIRPAVMLAQMRGTKYGDTRRAPCRSEATLAAAS